jgi:hypothetical protein
MSDYIIPSQKIGLSIMTIPGNKRPSLLLIQGDGVYSPVASFQSGFAATAFEARLDLLLLYTHVAGEQGDGGK